MKKRIVAFFIIIAFVLGLAACSGRNSGDNIIDTDLRKVSVSLNNMVADLSGAKQLGIIRREKTVMAVLSLFNNSYEADANSELVLVKINEQNNATELDFSDEDKAVKINQNESDLEIYKLHVTGDFTVMSFISSYWRHNVATQPVKNTDETAEFQSFYELTGPSYDGKYLRTERNIIDRAQGVPRNFDNIAFYNNDYIKSFIMDNRTGKIYSTEIFEVFDIINGLLVVRGYNASMFISGVYNFFVDQSGELFIRDVLPNKDVKIFDAFKDNDGWVYVQAAAINYIDAANKVIYFTGNKYCFASNGIAYEFGDDMSVSLYTFPIKEMKNGVASNITNMDFDRLTTIDDGMESEFVWQREATFMRDGIYFFDHRTDYVTNLPALRWGRDTINEKFIYLNLSCDDTQYSSGIFGFGYSKDFAMYYNSGSLYYFDLDWSEVENDGEIKMVSRDLLIEGVAKSPDYWGIQNGYLTLFENVYSKVFPARTEYYQVKLGESGKPVAELINNNVFNEDIIIIQPLN